MSTHQKVELSLSSIVKFFAVSLGLILIWQTLDILALLFVVLIIVAALEPTAERMVRMGIPRGWSVLTIFVVLFLALGLLVSLLVPTLVEQLGAFADSFPSLVRSITPLYELLIESDAQQLLNTITNSLSGFTQSVFSATAQVFGGAISAITVLVLSFYMLVDAKKTRDTLVLLVPADRVNAVVRLLDRTGAKLGNWLRGQLALSVIIGVISYIGFSILGVPYALTLAVLAGLFEIIPVVGPIISGLVAVLVAYASGSWQLGVGVLIFSIVLQQVENSLLVPKVMESAVGLSPIIVIIALLIGAKLAGVTGAIIAVPLAAAIAVLVQEWPTLKRASP